MNQQSPNSILQKRIGLLLLILLILGGGTYRYRQAKHPANTLPGNSNTVEYGPSKKSPLSSAAKNSAPNVHVSIASPSTGSSATPVVPAATSACMALSFHHKAVASHTDDETCSHHKNMIRLTDANINSKSICVRVNGTPVHYLSVKGHADELIIGSLAGPKAKITVKYCIGKQDCAHLHEDCSVPKDEFMTAIGGSQGKTSDPHLGQWDPSAAKEADVMARLDGDVKKELETNDDLNGRAAKGDELFKDWIVDNQSSVCGTQQASN